METLLGILTKQGRLAAPWATWASVYPQGDIKFLSKRMSLQDSSFMGIDDLCAKQETSMSNSCNTRNFAPSLSQSQALQQQVQTCVQPQQPQPPLMAMQNAVMMSTHTPGMSVPQPGIPPCQPQQPMPMVPQQPATILIPQQPMMLMQQQQPVMVMMPQQQPATQAGLAIPASMLCSGQLITTPDGRLYTLTASQGLSPS